jgi:hypothetical protein
MDNKARNQIAECRHRRQPTVAAAPKVKHAAREIIGHDDCNDGDGPGCNENQDCHHGQGLALNRANSTHRQHRQHNQEHRLTWVRRPADGERDTAHRELRHDDAGNSNVHVPGLVRARTTFAISSIAALSNFQTRMSRKRTQATSSAENSPYVSIGPCLAHRLRCGACDAALPFLRGPRG